MKPYPLAHLGRGRETHSLMPNGKTHCSTYFKDEPYPMDKIKPLLDNDIEIDGTTITVTEIPVTGTPGCAWCLKVLGVVK